MADQRRELRERFEAIRPELERAAAALAGASPARSAAELVEDTWRVVAAKRNPEPLRQVAARELACCATNADLRRLLGAGDLDGAFTRLLPHLRAWATNLSRGLPPPQPEPEDLVQDACVKLRAAPMFAAADNPLGYAFRAVKNRVIDHARRARRTVEISDRHLPTVEIEMTAERLQTILDRAGLSAEERCLLTRVVFEKLGVAAAQRACGGPAGAPYYMLDKILDKVARTLGIERSRR